MGPRTNLGLGVLESERKRMEETVGIKKGVSIEAMESISERLSSMENLYFPRALLPKANDPSHRKSILLDLISRDAAVFLERYGSKLTTVELSEFDVLKDDYEINWHLTHLRTLISPTSDDLRSRSVTVKNRRRAYLNKLISEGHYFSEDEMRGREPYLHHELVGKFQDPSGRSMARPGERWSETLLRRAEEAMLVAKIRGEQQRLGVDEKDWIGNEAENMEEEEEEEEADGEEEGEVSGAKGDLGGGAAADVGKADGMISSEVPCDHEQSISQSVSANNRIEGNQSLLSEAEMQDQIDQFTYIMQQKFLSGEDNDYLDYTKIDEDETLDDHWLKEVNCDAEEKYFEED